MKLLLASTFVNDPVEAFRFYNDVLGFKEQLYMPEHNLAIVVSPEDPEGTALLLEPSDNPAGKGLQVASYEAELPSIVFSVPDLKREHERLSALGVASRKPPTQGEAGFEAVFGDGCGNLIQLLER